MSRAPSSAEGSSHPSIRAAARSDSHRYRNVALLGQRPREAAPGPLSGRVGWDTSGRAPAAALGLVLDEGFLLVTLLRTAGPRARQRRHGRERHRALAVVSPELWLGALCPARWLWLNQRLWAGLSLCGSVRSSFLMGVNLAKMALFGQMQIGGCLVRHVTGRPVNGGTGRNAQQSITYP